MTDFLKDLLKDYDEEFGIDSKMDNLSSMSQQQDFSRQTPIRTSFQSQYSHQSSILDQQPPVQSINNSIRYQSNSPRLSNSYQSYQMSENTFQNDEPEPNPSTKPQIQSIPVPKINKISVDQATQIINDLKKERIKDAKKMQELQTENARLSAKITILEHTDMKVAELGSKVEQLLQKYLEAEQIRTQQAAQISQLRQEAVVLRSRIEKNRNQGI